MPKDDIQGDEKIKSKLRESDAGMLEKHGLWEYAPYDYGRSMSSLLLNIKMSGKTVMVAGGGRVAERKIRMLLDAGTVVRVVSPQISPAIAVMLESGEVSLKTGRYLRSDLDGIFLAVAATDDPEVNRRIAEDARSLGILVAVTDEHQSGDCSFPAVLRRGDLEIGVSTHGKCPAFAVEIRNLLSTVITDEHGLMLNRMAQEREKLLTEGSPSTYNGSFLRSGSRELIMSLADDKEPVP